MNEFNKNLKIKKLIIKIKKIYVFYLKNSNKNF